MDTGRGYFEQIIGDTANEQAAKEKMDLLEKLHPNHGGWFREGEIVELRGSTFKVKRIKPTEIVLKLVKRQS